MSDIRSLRLKIGKREDGTPSCVLGGTEITEDDGTPSIEVGGIELADVLASDGLKVEYAFQEWCGLTMPVVTMTFAPDGIDFDLDTDLLENLLRAKRAQESADE